VTSRSADSASRRLAQQVVGPKPDQTAKAVGDRTDAKLKEMAASVAYGAEHLSDRGNLPVAARDSTLAASQPLSAPNAGLAGKTYSPGAAVNEPASRLARSPAPVAGGARGLAVDEIKKESLIATPAKPTAPEPAGRPLVAARAAPPAEPAKPAPVAKASVTDAVAKTDRARELAISADTPAPAAPPVSLSASALKNPAPTDFYFARLQDDLNPNAPGSWALEMKRAELDKDAAVGAAPVPAEQRFGVLDRFEFRQSDSKITFIDTDGSIYEGVLDASARTPTGGMPLTSALALTERSRTTGDVEGSTRKTSPDTSGDAARAYRLVSFQVSGTNRTLREPVILSGVLRDTGAASPGSFAGKQMAPAASRASAGEYVAGRPASSAAPAAGPAAVRLGTGMAGNQPDNGSLAGAVSERADNRQSTNVLSLQGSLRVGTNAEKPFRAIQLR
jgi:hypothetical protein